MTVDYVHASHPRKLPWEPGDLDCTADNPYNATLPKTKLMTVWHDSENGKCKHCGRKF